MESINKYVVLSVFALLILSFKSTDCPAQPPYPAYPAMQQLHFDYNPRLGPVPPRRMPFRPYPGRAWGEEARFPPQATSVRIQDPSWTQHLIKDEDRLFNFGTVVRGTQNEHSFIIKNRFVETVRIAAVSSSCTCTTPIILNDKKELQTNDETAVVAHFHTEGFDGLKTATITVLIDKPYRAEFQLNVRGEIRSDLTITPNSVQFGPVKEGEGASRTLTVVYTGPMGHWKLIDSKSDNKHLSAEILETQAQPGRVVSKVKIIMDDQMPRGDFSERLFLISNDSAGRREIPLVAMGRVGTTIKVTPSTVFLGFLQPGEVSSVKNVTVRGTDRFRIVKILCNNPEVQVEHKPDPEGPAKMFYILPIRYTNPKEGPNAPKDGKMQALVRIETDNPDLNASFHVQMEISKEEPE